MAKKLSCLVFFVLISISSFAQQWDREQLAQITDSIFELDKSEQINAIRNLSFDIRKSKNPTEAYTILDELVGDQDFLRMAFYQDYAPYLSRKGDNVASKKLRDRGLKIAQQEGNLNYHFDFLNSLSIYHINLSQADSATLYTNKAETLIAEYPEQLAQGRWMLYRNRGDIQNILGNYSQVGEYYEMAWEIMKDDLENPNRGFMLYMLTDIFRELKVLDKQVKYAELLTEHFRKKSPDTPNSHLPVERLLLAENSPEAIADLEKMLRIADSLGNLNALSAGTITLAKAYIATDEPLKAVPRLKSTIAILDSANYLYNNTGERELLRQAYVAARDYENAYLILENQKQLEDSLRSQELLTRIADFEVKYETQQKELELQKTAANKKFLTVLLWGGFLVLLLVLYFLYRNRLKNKTLARQKKLLETTLDEKNVLLKEIHHRVKNSFQIVSSLLYLQSENIQDKEAQLAIKEAQNRVRSMVLIHQKLYNKDQLVGINTKEYFEDLTRDIFESHQFKSKPIKYATDIKPMVLDIETITPIGLILNELITNVLKHAFPEVNDDSEMQLRFNQKGESLVLELEDNGQGMPTEVAESSFGIKLMKALSKKLKANLSFTPSSSNGTLASLEITKFNALA